MWNGIYTYLTVSVIFIVLAGMAYKEIKKTNQKLDKIIELMKIRK